MRDAQDDRAWVEFVALYTPLVFGHCVRRGLQEAEAADGSDDEDGVTFTSALVPGVRATLKLAVSGGQLPPDLLHLPDAGAAERAYADAFIDWNGNGVFYRVRVE